MQIWCDETGTPDALDRLLQQACMQPKTKGILVLACDGNHFTPASINGMLSRVPVPLAGGIFPAVVHEGAHLQKGTVVVAVEQAFHVGLVEDISNADRDLAASIDTVIDAMAATGDTHVVFIDGFATRIGHALEGLFDSLGFGNDILGGGAGSLDMVAKPCIMTQTGLHMDAMLIATWDVACGIGVAHGWTAIEGPFRVTASDRNTIESLEWASAFDVYRTAVETHSGQRFTDDNFFDLAKAYPFGIAKLDAERIVRDPFQATEDGALVCVGEVSTGSHVEILHGDKPSLLAAARTARDRSVEAASGRGEPAVSLFMDCISRVLFLEEDFVQELTAVKQPQVPLIGACTIGEIANSSSSFVEFYNKTSVVGSIMTDAG